MNWSNLVRCVFKEYPNDPCFGWSFGLVFRGVDLQKIELIGAPGIYIYIYIYIITCSCPRTFGWKPHDLQFHDQWINWCLAWSFGDLHRDGFAMEVCKRVATVESTVLSPVVETLELSGCEIYISQVLGVIFADGRNPAPVEVASFSHYLQGFIHPRSSQVVQDFFHQLYTPES